MPTGHPHGDAGTGAVPRTEDARLLDGHARYVADLEPHDALWAVFVRSPLAHGRIDQIDVEEARAMPGVAAVWTAADLDPVMPAGAAPDVTARPLLARDTVRFAGEAVALVVAETPAAAVDAAESVFVDYDPLEAVVDVDAAADDAAPRLFPELGTNIVASHDPSTGMVAESGEDKDDAAGAGVSADAAGDVLADADVVVRGRFVNQRVAPVPLEAGATLAVPDGQSLTVWASTQSPFVLRSRVADLVGLDRDAVRVVVPDVGGAFGAKITIYPEQIAVAAAAWRLGRAVRWVEQRSESMQAMAHGRGQVQRVEVGATRDGVITGLRVRILADCGAYPTGPGIGMPSGTLRMACGTYAIPKVDARADCVVTTTTPVSAYRGAGRPEATALVERAVDLLADELGLDPVEVRRRNFVRSFPHTTVTGATYDTGDYDHALDLALDAADYDGLRREQAARRERGDPIALGVGLSTYVEVTAGAGMTDEFGAVGVDRDGAITVRTGISPHGQGHETSLAQIVAGMLAVPLTQVRVVHSDTAVIPRGAGTMGSRSLQIGGSAVRAAASEVLDRARRLAAHLLEVDERDVEVVAPGRVAVAGAPDRGFSWAELAVAADDPGRRPDDMEPGLSCEEVFAQDDATYPFGAHVAVVDVDTVTGTVTPRLHVAVDDCGTVLNPILVDGQVHGGLAQGIGQALWEEMTYDELGNLLTANLASYGVPMATEMPEFVLRRPETPTPLNPLGAKGVGEAATIGATPAVQNAVVDALSHLGVRHVDMPCSPERVWRALRDAR